jgi:hypothetical protein
MLEGQPTLNFERIFQMVQSSQFATTTQSNYSGATQVTDLLNLCRKSCETFQMAARYAETAAIRNLMAYYGQIREQFMDELNKMGRGVPVRALPPVNSETHIHTSDLLKMCEEVERDLATAYERLNYSSMPHESRSVLWQQYIEIRQCCHNLSTLYGVYRQL